MNVTLKDQIHDKKCSNREYYLSCSQTLIETSLNKLFNQLIGWNSKLSWIIIMNLSRYIFPLFAKNVKIQYKGLEIKSNSENFSNEKSCHY